MRSPMASNFTDDYRKIDVDTRVIQSDDSLRYEILVDSFKFGFLAAIFCYYGFFVKLVRKVAVLIEVHRAPPGKHERRRVSDAPHPGQALLLAFFSRFISATRT